MYNKINMTFSQPNFFPYRFSHVQTAGESETRTDEMQQQPDKRLGRADQ